MPVLERPMYPTLPYSGPRDGTETARVINVLTSGSLNVVVDMDLSGETSPYLLEHSNISDFSWIREMHDLVTVGVPSKGAVELTWSGGGPSMCRLLVIG